MFNLKRKIINVFIGAFVFFAMSGIVYAGTAHLTWTANSEDDLDGYKIYYDTTSHASGTCPDDYANHANPVDAGNVTSYYIDTLTPGQTYYFQLTAYDDSDNESDCSTSPGEVSKLITYRSDVASSTGNTPDHSVNIFDFNVLFSNWGQTGTGNIADFTRNNIVDSGDLTVMRNEFNQHF